ncbi:MAG TPA: Ni/Fe-hydrogenase cytochrome b subunit [bacterium]
MSVKHEPVGGPLFTRMFAIALAFAGIGAFVLAKRFMFGIGAVSHMSDGYPWGIWITYDVLIGTAIGCGGYAMALLVYVFNKGQYHPLVRSAVMTSMFGYGLAGVSVFVDIGRYWNMLNIFNPGLMNFNSVMLEVALCIATYCGILVLEFMPAFLEGFGGPNASKGYNKIMFILVAVGVLLPTMHQSSLGSMMIISGYKLSPLWQSGLLPYYNVITAILMGYAIVLFESYLSAVSFGRPFETHLLSKLAGVIPGLMIAYLVVRWADLLLSGALASAFSGMAGLMFWVENLLFVTALAMIAPAARRTSAKNLCQSGFVLLLACGVLKFNMYIIGFQPGKGWTYFPSVQEILVTLAIIAIEFLAYLIFVKKLPVLPAPEHA